jgi:hypothetical protein
VACHRSLISIENEKVKMINENFSFFISHLPFSIFQLKPGAGASRPS